jgi:hypothetical protein
MPNHPNPSESDSLPGNRRESKVRGYVMEDSQGKRESDWMPFAIHAYRRFFTDLRGLAEDSKKPKPAGGRQGKIARCCHDPIWGLLNNKHRDWGHNNNAPGVDGSVGAPDCNPAH